jgi:hypothetical protein
MIVGVVVCERKAARRYPVTASALDAAAVVLLLLIARLVIRSDPSRRA